MEMRPGHIELTLQKRTGTNPENKERE